MSLGSIDLEALLGADAAEDEHEERLHKYFLKTSVWQAVTDQRRPLRVLVGNKGTGKSAIFRVAAGEDEQVGRLPVFIRPSDLVGIAEGEGDDVKLVQAWKQGLSAVIISNALRSLGTGDETFFGTAANTSGRILDVLVQMLGKKQSRGSRTTSALTAPSSPPTRSASAQSMPSETRSTRTLGRS